MKWRVQIRIARGTLKLVSLKTLLTYDILKNLADPLHMRTQRAGIGHYPKSWIDLKFGFKLV